MADQNPAAPSAQPAAYEPTATEVRILAGLAGGLQLAEVADRLGIGLPAMNMRASRLRRRLGAATTAQAVYLATVRGLLNPQEVPGG